ncbi:MAG: carbohydrate kinase, partial [Kiritimatiellae bacterium]|nr:carbohydrate kinase [Kiritimatiellia bacterium]
MEKKPLAVGVDASTQGVKALALGPDGVEAVAAVNFGKDLPQFGAPDGFAPDPDPAVRRAPPRMWEAGVRLALERLGAEVDLGR